MPIPMGIQRKKQILLLLSKMQKKPKSRQTHNKKRRNNNKMKMQKTIKKASQICTRNKIKKIRKLRNQDFGGRIFTDDSAQVLYETIAMTELINENIMNFMEREDIIVKEIKDTLIQNAQNFIERIKKIEEVN